MVIKLGDEIRRFLPKSNLVVSAQTSLLLKHTKFQIVAAPLLGVFLVLAYSEPAERGMAWAWLAAIVFAYAARFLALTFDGAEDSIPRQTKLRWYLIGLAISGILWALAPLVIAEQGSGAQLFVGLFVGIVVLVGIVGNFLHYLSAFVYIATWIFPALVSFGVVYVQHFQEIGWTYAGIVLLFLLYTYKCLEIINLPLCHSLELNEALTREKERAEESDRAKSDFLAMMSHELRTPLNAIIGYSEIIRDDVFRRDVDDKYAEQAGHIREAAGLLSDLISDLLELTAMQVNGRRFNAENVELRTIVETTVELLNEPASRRDIRVNVEIPDSLPLLYVDRRAAIQCLSNILGNALKYSSAGSAVTIDAEPGENSIKVRVSDSGPGISAAELQMVIEPFRRGENAVTLSETGVGLGLAISNNLMTAQGGYLHIDSEPGNGTTVTLEFPVRNPDPQDNRPEDGQKVADEPVT